MFKFIYEFSLGQEVNIKNTHIYKYYFYYIKYDFN